MSVHSLKFVVIGGPGNGKSSVLNEFAQDDLFKVGAAGASCTQIGPDNVKKIMIEDGDDKFDITLVDTPGFPDPDAKKAAEYYDHVIEECNKKINGVLFVLKQDRSCAALMMQYETLLSQFVNLKPPLILLVNGLENPTKRERASPDFVLRRARAVDDLKAFGLEVVDRSGLHAREVLVSFCKDELHDLGKEVARVFNNAAAEESQIMTYKQVRDDLKRCEEATKAKELLRREALARIAKCEEDIQALEKDAKSLEDGVAARKRIPLVGNFGAETVLSRAREKRARIEELRSEIAKAEKAEQETHDLTYLQQKVKQLSEIATRMSAFLSGKLFGK